MTIRCLQWFLVTLTSWPWCVCCRSLGVGPTAGAAEATPFPDASLWCLDYLALAVHAAVTLPRCTMVSAAGVPGCATPVPKAQLFAHLVSAVVRHGIQPLLACRSPVVRAMCSFEADEDSEIAADDSVFRALELLAGLAVRMTHVSSHVFFPYT